MPGMTHGQIEGHTLGFDDTWVEFSWPRQRAILGGTYSGRVMMEGTRDDDDMVG